ncbi:unnamed protein product, partial [Iphiclides podalirius]
MGDVEFKTTSSHPAGGSGGVGVGGAGRRRPCPCGNRYAHVQTAHAQLLLHKHLALEPPALPSSNRSHN